MRIAVLGKKRTGNAVADYLSKHDISYDLFDGIAPDKKISLSRHYDKAIVSPGWPKDHNLIKFLEKEGTPVFSELEFASRLIKKPIIAVTGTNGKTTCCNLISSILNTHNIKIAMVGNMGIPLISYADDQDRCDLFVCEVSSFQMEFTDTFKPSVYILLNITEDHLDRHKTFQEYKFLKIKAIKNQDKDDFVITSLDKEKMIDFDFASKMLYFSLKKKADAYNSGSKINIGNFEIRIDELKLKGTHNVENIMAALLASSRFVELNEKKTEDLLKNFTTLKHRLEYIDSVDGVDFVDDSKATNVAAIKSAVNSLNKNGKIVLLLGGRYKGGSFLEIKDILWKIRAIVAFGESRGIIRSQLHSDNLYVVPALNLKGAIYGGFNFAAKGDTVLLSPGCSSFDEFESYKARGIKFKKIVSEIKRDYSY